MKRRISHSPSRSRSPPGGFGRGLPNGCSPTRGMGFGARFGAAGGLAASGRAGGGAVAGASASAIASGGVSPPPWVSNARLAPQVKMVLEGLYGRGKLGPGDLEYACIEFLELLGPVGGMAVLEEFASLDFFRIRNLTAFFIGICKRVQARAPPPPGRPLRGPDGNSPPPAGGGGGGARGRTLARGGAGGMSRSPGAGAAMRRASPPLHFMVEDNSPPLRRGREPPADAGKAKLVSSSAAMGGWAFGGLLAQALAAAAAGGGSGGCEGSVLRQAVTEHVKERLKPAWRANKLTRETFKAIAKTAVDRVLATLPNNGTASMYDSPASVTSYFSEARRECISRLVETLLHRLAASNASSAAVAGAAAPAADGPGQQPAVTCSPTAGDAHT
ncbi:hypothetical protein GPECTOR_119g397 [Gonium pectorale]|uniref:Heterogeneous nuclear ribonucleoprotein Q acidic domain-containing protein n=1 Tax=Gonium pectorale TaxID=33097 RepID=A0A150FYR7_GONPE|nr:hypothetical protein GPECTOR_119g397 [Gonium pectorale]|eukprot:KXZ42766.1 hypothetical protein GPECTOR_119g397 [Gonium pectorale]